MSFTARATVIAAVDAAMAANLQLDLLTAIAQVAGELGLPIEAVLDAVNAFEEAAPC